MKISITLLALATLFHTALGGLRQSCTEGEFNCDTSHAKPWNFLYRCEGGTWEVYEDCSERGMVCAKPFKTDPSQPRCVKSGD